ncbi:hypothetical protein [Microbispora sp. H10949]|uniref:hypothetical protein n=1 Tax=Microbispora sp. H10949 TaxID=2729111 RepID=UPI0015FF3C2F|nr:hypothetical protein [Microbispora sp. H10949]
MTPARRTRVKAKLAACGDCDGQGQALTAMVIGRGPRRRTVEQYAVCLTCSGTGIAPNDGATA